MGKIKIYKDTIVYVLCPAYIKTGGPELLHQLVYKLNMINIKAFVTYYGINEHDDNYTNDDFKKYVNDYKTIDDIIDDEKNVLITPESIKAIKNTKKFLKIRKAIWWLSVDNFLKGYKIINPLKKIGITNFLKALLHNEILFNFKVVKKMKYHLCQSYYAMDFLENKKISNALYLSDYINELYLNVKKEQIPVKEDNILYNPKKGIKFTKKIINSAKSLNWIPIQNMTTEEVRQILLKSKVYIDFGNHPRKR